MVYIITNERQNRKDNEIKANRNGVLQRHCNRYNFTQSKNSPELYNWPFTKPLLPNTKWNGEKTDQIHSDELRITYLYDQWYDRL